MPPFLFGVGGLLQITSYGKVRVFQACKKALQTEPILLAGEVPIHFRKSTHSHKAHLTLQALTASLSSKTRDNMIFGLMAGVAKWLRPRIVVPVFAGSSPVVCPSLFM